MGLPRGRGCGAKKYPEAIEAYQKALAINPNSGAYHNGLADAYAKSGQTDKAVAEYNAAAQAEPANAATYYFNEGAIFTNTGKVDDAIAAFDKTIQTDPNRAEAYYYKGINLMSKATTGKDGKFVAPAGTEEAFQKYLELKPDGPLAQPAKDMLAILGGFRRDHLWQAKSCSGGEEETELIAIELPRAALVPPFFVVSYKSIWDAWLRPVESA